MIDWSKLRTAEAAAKEGTRAAALKCLAETDWMVTRLADPSDGRPIPDEVLERRRAAREALNA